MSTGEPRPPLGQHCGHLGKVRRGHIGGLYERVRGHSRKTRVVNGREEISREKGCDQSFLD